MQLSQTGGDFRKKASAFIHDKPPPEMRRKTLISMGTARDRWRAVLIYSGSDEIRHTAVAKP